MSKNALENGVYCVTLTQPGSIPSSITSGVLMAENELFDKVYVKETEKKTKSLSISVATLNDKDQTDYHNHYHRDHRMSSSTRRLDDDQDEKPCLCCSKKTKEYICNFAVVMSLIVVVCLYSLGIVFFYTDVPKNEDFYDETLRNSLIDQLELCLELVSFVDNLIKMWHFKINLINYMLYCRL